MLVRYFLPILIFLVHIYAKIGLIVIPGLGRYDRIATVLSNLDILKQNIKSDWDCIIYIYAIREDESFWLDSKLPRIYEYCKIIEVPQQRFAQNLHMVQPPYLQDKFTYVFVLLDDIKLDIDFDLNRFIQIMNLNSLTAATPRIIGANTGGGQKFRLIMQKPPQNGQLGYKISFMEIFACIMTIPAYTSFWELLYPYVNPYGWGYDMWYDCYAKKHVIGHSMGIISIFTARHEQDLHLLGRTDNASIITKWNAVLKQERFYADYYHIPLKKCRQKMEIKNQNWDGAVVGFLHD